GIRCWDGLRRPRLPRSFADGGTGNVVFGRNVIPFLEGVLTVGDVVVSTVFLGTTRQVLERGFPALLVSRPTVGWRDDDAVDVSWSDRTMTIAWPPAADSGWRLSTGNHISCASLSPEPRPAVSTPGGPMNLAERFPLDELRRTLVPPGTWTPYPDIDDRQGWERLPDELRRALVADA